ncbi:MAG: permease [Akkermansiaceae bacterium]|nr:permease [Akkermansiaceae bacterium]
MKLPASELKTAGWLIAVLSLLYFLPVGTPRFDGAVKESLELAKWYAREHVIFCLVPAFFIAGAIGAFISRNSVIRYLGGKAHPVVAYSVASVSGTILAVCSCTVLPLFAGIYRLGAGIGPATAFLYSGPAINALAIILTARVLGMELGLGRAVGAVVFSVVIGLAMSWMFRKEEGERQAVAVQMPADDPGRPLWQTASFIAALVGILVFANWGGAGESGFFGSVHGVKWIITSAFAVVLGGMLWRWQRVPLWQVLLIAVLVAAAALVFGRMEAAFLVATFGIAWMTAGKGGETGEWFDQSWSYAKQIIPLLVGGVLVAGFLLGRPGHEGLIPSEWTASLLGGNSPGANAFASVAGALMYFATLTEIPVVQGLLGSGMGKGPALALLLAGPALSLPNMLVIRSIIGTKKTAAFVSLTVVLATLSGWVFGTFFS